ncbi:Ribosomal L32p protein family [Forsythia ovata]|uniref:Large ribosomal subunit protein bL32m n=1 Tax=Forsythia ovata TaxID=205694 RepID=A0ABD1WAN7_9LAMI
MLTYAFSSTGYTLGSIQRWAHAIAQPPPLGNAINHLIDTSPPLGFPEHQYSNGIEDLFPNWLFYGCSMKLMAVPKRKVSPHKRGIRNGPKALKPVPVIIRCKNS